MMIVVIVWILWKTDSETEFMEQDVYLTRGGGVGRKGKQNWAE